MSALAFDTYKFVKDLIKAGMSDAQAEVLATKDDLKIVHKEIEAVREDMKHDIKHLEERLYNKMMVTILSAQIVTIVTICTVMSYLLSNN